MKKTKNAVVSLVLALVMMVACVVPSFAADIDDLWDTDRVYDYTDYWYIPEAAVADNSGIYDITKDIKYCKYPDTEYDLYVPNFISKSADQHLILLMHSGAYTSGDKKQQQCFAQYYASRGYIVGNLNYTLRAGENQDASINMMDKEVLLCVKDIVKRTKKMGYKISTMAPAGFSAGGGLALLYANRHQDDSPIPIAFVFEGSGVTSFYFEDWYTEKAYQTVRNKQVYVKTMTGYDVTEKQVKNGYADKLLAKISPISYVNKNTVPTLMAHGGQDTVVPTFMSKEYKKKLKKYGVTYKYVYFENSGHTLESDPDQLLKMAALIDEYCDTYFNE